MASAADRFTRLEKVAVFLLVLGEARAREVLCGLDVETLEQISAAILGLGEVTPSERAAVMVEFGDMFCHGKPLGARLQETEPAPLLPAPAPPPAAASQGPSESAQPAPRRGLRQPTREDAARSALEHLRQRVDPAQIDWSRAGYDFGEGFKGPPTDRERD